MEPNTITARREGVPQQQQQLFVFCFVTGQSDICHKHYSATFDDICDRSWQYVFGDRWCRYLSSRTPFISPTSRSTLHLTELVLLWNVSTWPDDVQNAPDVIHRRQRSHVDRNYYTQVGPNRYYTQTDTVWAIGSLRTSFTFLLLRFLFVLFVLRYDYPVSSVNDILSVIGREYGTSIISSQTIKGENAGWYCDQHLISVLLAEFWTRNGSTTGPTLIDNNNALNRSLIARNVDSDRIDRIRSPRENNGMNLKWLYCSPEIRKLMNPLEEENHILRRLGKTFLGDSVTLQGGSNHHWGGKMAIE